MTEPSLEGSLSACPNYRQASLKVCDAGCLSYGKPRLGGHETYSSLASAWLVSGELQRCISPHQNLELPGVQRHLAIPPPSYE